MDTLTRGEIMERAIRAKRTAADRSRTSKQRSAGPEPVEASESLEPPPVGDGAAEELADLERLAGEFVAACAAERAARARRVELQAVLLAEISS